MKIDRAYEKFAASVAQMQCPLCGSSFTLEKTGAFHCQNRHCFDLSAKGYVNFVPARQKADYSPQLFEHRKKAYHSGLYSPVLSNITQLIGAHFSPGQPASILDAGCGEGYYATAVSQALAKNRKTVVFAADVSKDAIKMAETKNEVLWMAADIAHLPLKSDSLDCVLNILSPANYSEFNRVLKPSGLLLKVVPGAQYLQEIRAAASAQLKQADYTNAKTIAHFTENFNLVERIPILYQQTITPDALNSLLHMTPLTRSIDLGRLHTTTIDKITIHMEFLLGKTKENQHG